MKEENQFCQKTLFEGRSFKIFFMFRNARNVTSQFVYRLTKILRIQRVGSKQKIRKS